MIELVDLNTGNILAGFDYDITEYIEKRYGGFCSLITNDNELIVGAVHPELAWRAAKKELNKRSDDLLIKQS